MINKEDKFLLKIIIDFFLLKLSFILFILISIVILPIALLYMFFYVTIQTGNFFCFQSIFYVWYYTCKKVAKFYPEKILNSKTESSFDDFFLTIEKNFILYFKKNNYNISKPINIYAKLEKISDLLIIFDLVKDIPFKPVFIYNEKTSIYKKKFFDKIIEMSKNEKNNEIFKINNIKLYIYFDKNIDIDNFIILDNNTTFMIKTLNSSKSLQYELISVKNIL
jgi:hypothetical protein